MGIQDLTKTIKKYAPGAIKTLAITDVPGNCFGVDVFSYLYPTKYNPSAKGKGNHIRFFFDMITYWRNTGKSLVMVFDGNNSLVEAKEETNQKRQEARAKIKETIAVSKERIQSKTATDEDYINLDMASRNDIHVTEKDINDLKTLFNLTGTCYYQAKGEADCLLGALYQNGKIDGAISEDSDMMTHGVGCVIRGLIDSRNRNNGIVDVYSLKDVLSELSMTTSQFIDFCILCGCDYCKRIPNIGSVTAMKYIQKWGSVLAILDNIEIEEKEAYHVKYKVAFKIFSEHSIPDESEHVGHLDPDTCRTWILENTNYRIDTLEEKMAMLDIPPQLRPEPTPKLPIKITIKPRVPKVRVSP